MDALLNSLAGIAPWWSPIVLAPFIGSFLGVLIVRLPAERPVFMARSACDHCGHRLAARDLVPWASYMLTRGRCRYCHARIGLFPLAVECAAVAVAIWAAVAGAREDMWVTCLFGWTLLTLAWIDFRAMILPDVLTLPLLASGLIVTRIADPEALWDHTIAGAAGYLSLAGIALAYRRWRGRDGLGLGDAKLLAAIGAWLGLEPLPATLFLAASTGLIATSVAMLAGRRVTRMTALPFGPWLALAAWLSWLHWAAFEDWLTF